MTIQFWAYSLQQIVLEQIDDVLDDEQELYKTNISKNLAIERLLTPDFNAETASSAMYEFMHRKTRYRLWKLLGLTRTRDMVLQADSIVAVQCNRPGKCGSRCLRSRA